MYSSPVALTDLDQQFTIAFGTESVAVFRTQYYAFSHFTQPIYTRRFGQVFAELAATWKREERNTSSIHKLITNPSYLEIISYGKDAVPYIVHDLQREPHLWFTALKIITKADPVPAKARGDILTMTNLWLRWAISNGYAPRTQ